MWLECDIRRMRLDRVILSGLGGDGDNGGDGGDGGVGGGRVWA